MVKVKADHNTKEPEFQTMHGVMLRANRNAGNSWRVPGMCTVRDFVGANFLINTKQSISSETAA